MSIFKELTPRSRDAIILLVGITILVAWASGYLAKKIRAPQLIGFILLGVVLGTSVLGIIDYKLLDQLAFINYLALAFIGFDIGSELSLKNIRRFGRTIITITIFQAVGAFVLVTLGVFLITQELYIALIFGSIATATAAAATVEVLREYHASGPVTTTLFAVVGLGDALAVTIYTFASLAAKSTLGGQRGIDITRILVEPFLEIFYGVAIGVAMGVLMTIIARKIRQRRAIMIIGLGAIIVCIGAANVMGASLILANMALGATMVNIPRYRRTDIAEVIRDIDEPILMLFFVLVGAHLDVTKLGALGLTGLAYIILRSIGVMGGSWSGARLSHASPNVGKYLGLCLVPQAGIAIGLSIQAMNEFGVYGVAGQQLGMMAVTVIAATTLILEILGAITMRHAIIKAGEATPLARP